MTKRRPPPKRRSSRTQDERRVVRLLTEGRLTEVEYFAKWATEFRNQISVEFDPFHGSPMSLVKRAVELIEDRRRRGSDVTFDEIWCIFDRDEHPFVDEAIALARQNEIGVGYSNPCFELWFVLHEQDVRRHTERHDMQRLSAKLGLTIGKSLGPDSWPVLRDSWEVAETRAAALDAMHQADGSPTRSNPSTSVAEIVRSIRRR